jgi:hypothetical protein
LTINLGWSELETKLCTDEAGDIERLRYSKEFCGKFRTPGGGGGVGEKEPLSFEDLTRVDCEVAVPWMEEGGVGEMESLFCIHLIGIGWAVAVLVVCTTEGGGGVGKIESLLCVCLVKTG